MTTETDGGLKYQPEVMEYLFNSASNSKELFRIISTADGLDIKVADGVTMTEAAAAFIEYLKQTMGKR